MNPHAPAFKPLYSDQHCLYVTFSNGFPLTESQVFNFFHRIYAPYVEKVFVYRPKGGRGQPLFGKVMFKHSLIPGLFLGNSEKVCVYVDGRHLFCKRFENPKTKTAAEASDSLGDGGSHHGGDDSLVAASDSLGDGGSHHGGDEGSDHHGGDEGSEQ